MSNYTIINPRLGLPGIEDTSTTQADGIELGATAYATHSTYGGGAFVYLQGATNTVVGSWVTYNEDDYSTALLAVSTIGQVAVAMSANEASQFGWYQVKGKAIGKGLSGLDADDANVYATGTAGSVDDAVVAGDRVKRCKTASAVGTPSSGLAEFEIHTPYMDDGLAA